MVHYLSGPDASVFASTARQQVNPAIEADGAAAMTESGAARARGGRFGDSDVYLFRQGTHRHLHRFLGAHVAEEDGESGVRFTVWAPNAAEVSLVGDFNAWTPGTHPLALVHTDGGLWSTFVPGIGPGTRYKYRIASRYGGYTVDKADPFAFATEIPPSTASVVWDGEHDWQDDAWMRSRAARNGLDAPMSIYELHLGSWCRVPEDGNRSMTYREIAPRLAEYVTRLGFTHVELMPIMEHPFYGSWGYQCTGYFAPTSRYGSPEDFMFLVDTLHQAGVGVILDWVPSHFPSDAHGLGYFDGTHLYEHADRRQGFHPEWNTEIFNFGRDEVRSFLISSAVFWLERFHCDGLRVDAVASMLYLDYSRKPGEWVPNRHGGRENLEAIAFLRAMNEAVYAEFPDVQTIAEESTAWPQVSRPVYLGGLGFGMKWNMGWMHDTLAYLADDPVHRKFHHARITFSIWYAFHENFVLPLSHDEVVYGKGSLLGRMPGDDWRRFANLRLLFAYQWAHPGKKLVFMGGEFGQYREWNHDASLDWHLVTQPAHAGVQRLVSELNGLYRGTPALHERDFATEGFRWVQADDADLSVIAFLRRGRDGDWVLAVFNFTPVVRDNYRLGVPVAGFWAERLNTDATQYGGSGQGNLGGVESAPLPAHGHFHSIALRLPPLGALFLTPTERPAAGG